MTTDHEENDELFSADPEEQMRIENEILRLKLKAELGGELEGMTEVPADIENLFLKNVIAFEHQHAHAPTLSVYELIDKPAFKRSGDLSESALAKELKYLERVLEKKGIVVDYLADYTDRLKYEFVTEELFEHEAAMVIMPGMTTHYIYEEFHPNHAYDIDKIAGRFIDSWISKELVEQSFYIADELLQPDGNVITKEELLSRLTMLFDSYDQFVDPDYNINVIEFELLDEERGKAIATGNARYVAVLDTGEEILFEGDFTFYFEMSYNLWQINFFDWPGFKWG